MYFYTVICPESYRAGTYTALTKDYYFGFPTKKKMLQKKRSGLKSIVNRFVMILAGSVLFFLQRLFYFCYYLVFLYCYFIYKICIKPHSKLSLVQIFLQQPHKLCHCRLCSHIVHLNGSVFQSQFSGLIH